MQRTNQNRDVSGLYIVSSDPIRSRNKCLVVHLLYHYFKNCTHTYCLSHAQTQTPRKNLTNPPLSRLPSRTNDPPPHSLCTIAHAKHWLVVVIIVVVGDRSPRGSPKSPKQRRELSQDLQSMHPIPATVVIARPWNLFEGFGLGILRIVFPAWGIPVLSCEGFFYPPPRLHR